MKKNVAQEETSMSNAFWATCQTYRPRIMGIQLFSLGCWSPLCVRRCGTSHTTASEASGHMIALNVPLIKYSHNGKRNNDFVNLSLQVLCLLNWLFTQQNCYLLGKNFAKLDYAQRNKKISTKKPRKAHIQTQSSRYAMWARRVKVKADTTSLLILLKLLLSLVYSKSVLSSWIIDTIDQNV